MLIPVEDVEDKITKWSGAETEEDNSNNLNISEKNNVEKKPSAKYQVNCLELWQRNRNKF